MGTTKVSALVAEHEDERLRVIGVGTAPATGMRQGVVVDIERAAAAVERAVREAERMAGVTPGVWSVGVAGEHVRSMNSRGVVAIDGIEEEITHADVARAVGAARRFVLPPDREILHTLPQEYIVDRQSGIRQPAGMYGTRLEARVHVVTASRPALDNVAKVLELADVTPGDLVLEPLASGTAVLSEEEREGGVAMLDIGGGTTDVVVYRDGAVVASGVIALGGSDITNDVAYGLRTTVTQAERIKVRYGCALSVDGGPDEMFAVETPGGRRRFLPRQLLSGIIEPRVAELLELVDAQLEAGDLKRSLACGVVLTGGTSMLRGIRELAEQVFDLPTRIGRPVGIDGLCEVVGHPRFATAVGLLSGAPAEAALAPHRARSRGWVRSFDQLKRAIASFI